MKLFLTSALVLSSLAVGCKSPSKQSQKAAENAAGEAEDMSSGDAASSSEDGDSAAEDSVKSVMGADLQRALVNEAKISEKDAAEIVKAGDFSVSLVSGSIASDAASFLSGVLQSLSSPSIKVPDLQLALRTIGSSVTTSVIALAGSKNEFELGGVPDLAKPEVLEAIKAMFGNGLARLPGADKVSYVYHLIQGMMKAIGSSGEKLSSAQFTGIVGSLSSGILASAGNGLNATELSSFVKELARGLASGSSLVPDFPVANIGDLSKSMSDGLLKGVGSIAGFDLNNLGSVSKSAAAGLMKGAGEISAISPSSLESVARSSYSGLLSGAKTIPGFEAKYIAGIGSSSISGFLEEAAKIPAYDKQNLIALAKSASSGLMSAAGAFGKLDAASLLAIGKSAGEGVAVALKNLNLLTSLDVVGKIMPAVKDGLKEGAASISGFDVSSLDSALPSSVSDILSTLLK